MARSLTRHLSLEMVLLCLIELVISFALIYGMVVSSTALDPAPLGMSAWSVRLEGLNLAAMFAFTIGTAAVAVGLYRPELCLGQRRTPLYAIVACALAFPAVLLISQTLQIHISNSYMLWLGKVLLAWTGCVVASRWVFAAAIRHKLFVRPIIVLGDGARASRVSAVVREQNGRLFELAGAVACDDAGALAALLSGRKIWGVVAAGERHSLPAAMLLECKLRGVRVFDDVAFWEQHLGRIDLATIGPDWLLFSGGLSSGRLVAAVRRFGDVMTSLCFLAAALPLMLVVAVLIKLDSPGSVFYRQERIGLHGRVFTVLKFRSMRSDAESGGKPRWASKNDPRITRVGGFIRATRIDELPQLFNVLGGSMSFIGPRPERPLFVEELAQAIPFYNDRSYVRPGITGWAQVNFPYGASVEDAREKLSYDLYYVKNRSLFLDLLILVSTVRVILFQEGAR